LSIEVPPWVLTDKVTSWFNDSTETIIGCPWEAFNTKNNDCPGWMGPLTTPVVAFDRKLMRVAAGGINVDPTAGSVGMEKVGETVKVGVIVAGRVGVIAGVMARWVAATMVSTALGVFVGMVDPRQAVVMTRIVNPAAKRLLVLNIHIS
jgi:hypothetical protein